MNLKLHHASLLTEDVEGTVAFYQEMLGMRVYPLAFKEDLFNRTFLQDGTTSSRFLLEIVGPPFDGWMDDYYSKFGPMRSHFCFVTEDLKSWHTKLLEYGVEIISPPSQFGSSKEIYLKDESGIAVQIMQYDDEIKLLENYESHSSNRGFDYSLHHISMVCSEIAIQEGFYGKTMGLKTIYDKRYRGILFMADSSVIEDDTRFAPSLEFIGPPGLLPRETDFLQRYGPGIDHVSFIVPDVDAAYQELKSKGAKFHIDPVDSGVTRLAFFKDPNGVDIEIELPNLNNYFDM